MALNLTAYIEHRKRSNKAKQAFQKVPLVDFDETNFADFFFGTSPKTFLQCRGSYLLDMFREIRSDQNTNYVTCVDQLIKDNTYTEEQFKDFPVSVILKTPSSKRKEIYTRNELITSRIASTFGIPTEYVAPIEDNPDKYIAVDFLNYDQKLETLSEFVGEKLNFYNYDKEGPLKYAFQLLMNETLRFFKDKGRYANALKLKRILVDFVTQYFFKKYIVHDSDFCGVNVGIILSHANKNMNISPAYDFESCFMPGIRSAQGYGLEDDIEFLAKNYPSILKSVLETFTMTDEREAKIKGVFEKFEADENLRQEHFNLINNSIISLQGFAKIIQSHNNCLKDKKVNTSDNIM